MKNYLFIILVAIALRLVFCFYLFPNFLANYGTVGNVYLFDDYYEIASQLISGQGFSLADDTRVFHRPPLYSLFLTLPAVLAQAEKIEITPLIQILHSLLAGLSVWIVIVITRMLTSKTSLAPIIAGYLVALWPFSIWITKSSIPENLLLFLVPLQLLFAIRFFDKDDYLAIIFFGATNGLLYLTHASYLAFSLTVFIAIFIGLRWKESLIIILLTLAGFFIIISPWVLRNQTLGMNSISSATGFGLHYLKGWYYFQKLEEGNPYFLNLEEESAKWANHYIQNQGLEPILSSQDRSDLIKMKKIDQLAITHLKEHFPENIIKVLIKAPTMWIRQQSNLRALFNFIILLPIIFLSWFGLKKLNWRIEIVILAPLIGLTVAMALVFVEDAPMRYALPLFPLLAILSGIGAENLNSKRFLFYPRKALK